LVVPALRHRAPAPEPEALPSRRGGPAIGAAVDARPVALRRLAPFLRRAGTVLVCLLLASTGVWIGVRLASPGEYDTVLGRVSVRVPPGAHGELEAFIPLAAWGVRARPYSGPIKVHVEPRTVDREMVVRAAGGDQALLASTVHDLRSAVRHATLRALRSALLGAVAVALIVLLVLLGRGERRKRL